MTAEEAPKMIRRREFQDIEHVKGRYYMVKMKPHTCNEDVPIALGSFILTMAKQVMLSFYFDFLDKYFDRKDWELVSMDTDSVSSFLFLCVTLAVVYTKLSFQFYFGCSKDDLHDAVKPEMIEEYNKNK